jgi:hypothetical protein
MPLSPLADHSHLNSAGSPVGPPARTLRQKRDLVSPVFSSCKVGNSHSVLIEHDIVRHVRYAVRHTKPHAIVTVDLAEPGEIVAARITASDGKRLIANAFRDAA